MKDPCTVLARCQLVTYCQMCETGTFPHDNCSNPPDSQTYMSFQQANKLVFTNDLPIDVILSHYYGKAVIGRVIDWINDGQALRATILLDDDKFLDAIRTISRLYFSQRNLPDDPLLYLRKIFPGFSLCHEKFSLTVDHVAIVCLPKRHGAIADYEWTQLYPPRHSEYEDGDIKDLITAVTSEGLTIDGRTDILRENLKHSRSPNDSEFIYAGVSGGDNSLLNSRSKGSKNDNLIATMEQMRNELLLGILKKALGTPTYQQQQPQPIVPPRQQQPVQQSAYYQPQQQPESRKRTYPFVDEDPVIKQIILEVSQLREALDKQKQQQLPPADQQTQFIEQQQIIPADQQSPANQQTQFIQPQQQQPTLPTATAQTANPPQDAVPRILPSQQQQQRQESQQPITQQQPTQQTPSAMMPRASTQISVPIQQQPAPQYVKAGVSKSSPEQQTNQQDAVSVTEMLSIMGLQKMIEMGGL